MKPTYNNFLRWRLPIGVRCVCSKCGQPKEAVIGEGVELVCFSCEE